MWKTPVPSLGWEDPLEKERTVHSRILAGQGSLAGYTAHGVAKELDMTYRLNNNFISHTSGSQNTDVYSLSPPEIPHPVPATFLTIQGQKPLLTSFCCPPHPPTPQGVIIWARQTSRKTAFPDESASSQRLPDAELDGFRKLKVGKKPKLTGWELGVTGSQGWPCFCSWCQFCLRILSGGQDGVAFKGPL